MNLKKKNVLLLVLESLGAHDLFLLGGVAPLGGHNNDGGIDETLGDFDLKQFDMTKLNVNRFEMFHSKLTNLKVSRCKTVSKRIILDEFEKMVPCRP